MNNDLIFFVTGPAAARQALAFVADVKYCLPIGSSGEGSGGPAVNPGQTDTTLTICKTVDDPSLTGPFTINVVGQPSFQLTPGGPCKTITVPAGQTVVTEPPSATSGLCGATDPGMQVAVVNDLAVVTLPAGSDSTLTLNNCAKPPAVLTVCKLARGATTSDFFDFKAAGQDLTPLSNGDCDTISLAPGPVHVTETPKPGWKVCGIDVDPPANNIAGSWAAQFVDVKTFAGATTKVTFRDCPAPACDLTLSKTVVPPTPLVSGQTAMFTITLTNNGQAPCGPVKPKGQTSWGEKLPVAGLQFQSVSAPPGWTCAGGGTGCHSNTVILPGGSVSFTVTAKITATGGTINNCAVVFNPNDVNASNNTGCTGQITVSPPPPGQLRVCKQVVDGGPPGSQTFGLVTAKGTTSISVPIGQCKTINLPAGSTATVTEPPGYTLVSCTVVPASQGSCSTMSRTASVTIPSGALVTVTFYNSLVGPDVGHPGGPAPSPPKSTGAMQAQVSRLPARAVQPLAVRSVCPDHAALHSIRTAGATQNCPPVTQTASQTRSARPLRVAPPG